MISPFRQLLVVVLVGWVLLPVVTTSDDCALLSAVMSKLQTSGPAGVQKQASEDRTDASVSFWLHFENMSGPEPLSSTPEIARQGVVTPVEWHWHSEAESPRSGRGPPPLA